MSQQRLKDIAHRLLHIKYCNTLIRRLQKKKCFENYLAAKEKKMQKVFSKKKSHKDERKARQKQKFYKYGGAKPQ